MAPILPTLALAALALAASEPAQGRRPHLPPGPAARALAGVGAETAAHDPAQDWAELAALLGQAEPWSEPGAWELWASLVEAEAASREADPRRRAGLALLARAQGRDADAWAHLAATGADPRWTATTLPYLFPGIGFEAAPGGGGRPARLSDGARLAPALPPDAHDVLFGRSAKSELRLRGLEVGAGRIDVRLALEPTGVELELTHAGGGPVRLEVLLPTPPQRELRLVYVDWIRQDSAGVQRVELSAEDEHPRQIYGRYEPRREPMPASPTGEGPAGLGLGGLRLVPRSEGVTPTLVAAAAALARVVGVEAEVGPAGSHRDPTERAFDGVVVEVGPGAAGARTLARIVSAAEAWRLARGPR